ncbi:MAG: c-type cytochrome [Saprospiraceae bacterium]|nr:c-type cytochrome [Saprospiraceae bacterium]
MSYNKHYIFFACMLFAAASCQKPGGNSTGSEYMPDMGHSVAYEANVYGYYYLNRWGSEKSLREYAAPRNPVAGTIPRGYAGSVDAHTGMSGVNAKAYAPNGSVPYYYADTPEERIRATNEIIKNPFPITEAGLAIGKELYTINCAICHGDKGDGAGYLVRDDGKYPAQPANFMTDVFITASNGRFYHSIIYGLNVMGGYADKLSYKERWDVIHYIRSLQAASKNVVYNEKANTLNSVDVPFASMPKPADAAPAETSVEEEAVGKPMKHDGNH